MPVTARDRKNELPLFYRTLRAFFYVHAEVSPVISVMTNLHRFMGSPLALCATGDYVPLKITIKNTDTKYSTGCVLGGAKDQTSSPTDRIGTGLCRAPGMAGALACRIGCNMACLARRAALRWAPVAYFPQRQFIQRVWSRLQ